MSQSRQVKQQFVATRLCKFHLEGRCSRGTACTFAHTEDDLRKQPDYSKTRLCSLFQRTGHCWQGSACKFAHGSAEMQRHAAAKQMRNLMQHQDSRAMGNAEIAEQAREEPPRQLTADASHSYGSSFDQQQPRGSSSSEHMQVTDGLEMLRPREERRRSSENIQFMVRNTFLDVADLDHALMAQLSPRAWTVG
eukprot:TRINITY_DN67846_c0_g1_i1.p1 TRINITY_DN67846_c0_g1~~TRINITY_DN67846_c0_g1_i1.p1  ORF type:complete len:193 (-),score=35.23 TRINITY_DN67846_c0_g1_i1:353-931(-)